VFVGFENYTRVLTDERIRGPFFSVFIWNIVFGVLSVILPFAIGLGAALVLQHKGMRGVRAYRSVLILPYAIPAFLTTLVWQGLLNRDFGFINQVLLDGASINWLGDPWLARFSVVFIQLWLGFPYFLIVSTGALTSIPDDVLEAAKMDGANASQTFWRVKWPLLLVAVSPLLIASFAFNFNNYNVIRFSTNGGPTDTTAAVSVGATDILITFVDKLAFAGATRQYGFASAIAVVIFVLGAGISYFGFKRTQTFEEID
jgi:arabinogalactan oligomer/maltooligosaccharide transport system permease protein